MKDRIDLPQEQKNVIHKPKGKLTIEQAYELLSKQEAVKCLMKALSQL